MTAQEFFAEEPEVWVDGATPVYLLQDPATKHYLTQLEGGTGLQRVHCARSLDDAYGLMQACGQELTPVRVPLRDIPWEDFLLEGRPYTRVQVEAGRLKLEAGV